MRIRIPLIQALAFPHSSVDGSHTLPPRLVVGLCRILSLDGPLGYARGFGASVGVVGEDGVDFSGEFGAELVPELSEGFLGGLSFGALWCSASGE